MLHGSKGLDKAYELAQAQKRSTDTYEDRFTALKEDAPDLTKLVVEEQLSLEEAEGALEQRLSLIRREKLGVAHGLHTLAQNAFYLASEKRREQVAQFVASEAELYQKENHDPIDEVLETLRIFQANAGDVLARINELKENANA